MSRSKYIAAAFLALMFVLAITLVPRPPKAERVAYEQAEKLAEVTADACRASIRFEHPRASAGLTRTARSLPDGSFLIVQPFTVGKLERSARCVGRADGSFEFTVERAPARMASL